MINQIGITLKAHLHKQAVRLQNKERLLSSLLEYDFTTEQQAF